MQPHRIRDKAYPHLKLMIPNVYLEWYIHACIKITEAVLRISTSVNKSQIGAAKVLPSVRRQASVCPSVDLLPIEPLEQAKHNHFLYMKLHCKMS